MLVNNLWCMQPAVLLLQQVHVSVEVVKELVLQHIIIDKVPLPSCVVVALAVTNTRKIQPLGMTELIA